MLNRWHVVHASGRLAFLRRVGIISVVIVHIFVVLLSRKHLCVWGGVCVPLISSKHTGSSRDKS